MVIWWLVHRLQPLVSPRWLERRRVAAVRADCAQGGDRILKQPERILIDVTMIAYRDAGTGIQRVVRSTSREMLAHPQGLVVQPIRFMHGAFRHTAWPAADAEEGDAVAIGAGDVFLGLDMSLDAIRRNAKLLRARKRAGARFWFVIYDLLPLKQPRHFSSKVAARFRWWLTAIAGLADGFLCISQHTADDLQDALTTRFGLCGVADYVIPMGFDLTTRETAPAAVQSAAPVTPGSIILAVGTIEPRKGYAVLLDAFEVLWAGGVDATLVIVGRPGWKTEPLQQRILMHAEITRRLHWLPALDDAGLVALYDRADALVAASSDEGFGLPVLEAIARGRPILARDIPAFRAHAHHGLRYFPRDADAEQLARALADLLHSLGNDRIPTLAPMLPSWRDTAAAVFDRILGSR